MSRLPSLGEESKYLPQGDQNTRSLYGNLVLPAEEAAMAADKRTEAIYSRVVGYLLLRPPSETARGVVTLELASCSSDSEPFMSVYGLGAMYLKHLIQIFKRARARTPTPSEHPSRGYFYNPIRDKYLQNVRATPQDHLSAKAAGLVRDDYRCILTGRLDYKYGTVRPDDDSRTTRTVCCHIFPESLSNIAFGGTGAEERPATSVWTILERFGYTDVCEQLQLEAGAGAAEGTNFHRMENILTLDMVIYHWLDDLMVWLEDVPGERDCYYMRLAAPLTHCNAGIPEKVQFVAHSDHPLPSPRLLQIHAACCRIAHLSGAAKHLDEVLDEAEEIKVLDPGGSSAAALEYSLLRCGGSLATPP